MDERSQTTRTVDDVLRDYEVIFSGRTRYAGQEPRDDELLVAEIKRLRSVIRGCEIALNRDEYPDGARRLIREERANHGW